MGWIRMRRIRQKYNKYAFLFAYILISKLKLS